MMLVLMCSYYFGGVGLGGGGGQNFYDFSCSTLHSGRIYNEYFGSQGVA